MHAKTGRMFPIAIDRLGLPASACPVSLKHLTHWGSRFKFLSARGTMRRNWFTAGTRYGERFAEVLRGEVCCFR